MKIKLVAPLVYYYPEEYAEDNAQNAPDTFVFGHGFKLEKIDKSKLIKPLLENRHGQDIFSDYKRSLIMDFSSHAITRIYEISQESATDTAHSKEIRETKRLLRLLRMALGIGKRTHLVFQDFHIKEGDESACFSTSLNLEGSYWDAHQYYPVDIDVSYMKSDLEIAKTIFNELVELPEDYSRVFNACYYFEMARLKGDRDYRLQFALLVTALESLFNTSPNQISETLALRYVYMMFDDATERLEAYRNLKEIYKLRSHIVHGQQIPKKFLNRNIQDKLLGDLEYLTRRLLVHIFESDLVESLNGTDVDEYFSKITVGAN